MKQAYTSSNWFGKASAGLILGFILALGVAGLIKASGGPESTMFSSRGQFSMWMMAPVWGLVLSLCFLFRTGLQAWVWLATANCALWIWLVSMGVTVL